MSSAQEPSDNIFERLPEDLICSIFMRCSPINEVRAAASCKRLQTVYRQHNKHLTTHSASVKANTVQTTPLCPINMKKLLLTLDVSSTLPDYAKTYMALQNLINQTKQAGITHLVSVQELAIQHCATTAIQKELQSPLPSIIQQLLQLLPHLKTLWLADSDAVDLLLASNCMQAQSTIHRASLEVGSHTDLALLPAALPNLDTLCLTMPAMLGTSYLHPLSRLSQLQYLSLDVRLPSSYQPGPNYCQDILRQGVMPDMRPLSSLRHLKLQTGMLDAHTLSGLSQVTSLSLFNIKVANPAALAQLHVTSMMLRSVSLHKQELGNVAVKQLHSGPCWPKLTRIYLGGSVSEQLLQAMLLPHPATTGFTVKFTCATFDNFRDDYNKRLHPMLLHRAIRTDPWYVDLKYEADAMPVLGTAYVAAAHVTSLQMKDSYAFEAIKQLEAANAPVQELYIVPYFHFKGMNTGCSFPTLKQLGLGRIKLDSDGWCNWLLKCPLLTGISYALDKASSNSALVDRIASLRTAADRLGITLQHESYMRLEYYDYCVVRLSRTSH